MGMGKMFIGVVIMVIGIAIWFTLSTPQGALTQVMFANAGERANFADAVKSLQFIYFLLVIGSGIGMIIWGSQS